MKRIGTVLLLTVLSAGNADGQDLIGSVRESLTIESEILSRSVVYSIYLPPDYADSGERYPVVYLLHGGGGDETSLLQQAEAHRTADRLIRAGAIPPMVLVMPDADRSRYLNNFDGSVRYEDFFFQELIPHIESEYRVVAEKRARGVAGISMGGFGSLVYGLRHPAVFAAAASLSGSFCEEDRVLAMSTDEWNESTRGPVYGLDLDGEDRLTDHYMASDPCQMVANGDPEVFNTVRLYLDCGDDDFRTDGNARLHMLMRRLGIQHEYRVRDGAHDYEYFRPGLADILTFIGGVFGGR